jgi:hypothetical protein
MVMTTARRIALVLSSLSAMACGGQTLAPEVEEDAGALDADSFLGNACVDDTECPGHTGEAGVFGEGPFCLKSHAGVALPKGYCSARCSRSADCPGPPQSAVCGTFWSDDVDAGVGNVCFRTCEPTAPGSCREGYSCGEVKTADSPGNAMSFACWTNP